MVQQTHRRSRIIVNSFQGKLLKRFVGYWVIYQLTMCNFLFLWQVFREGQGNLAEQFSRFFMAHYPMLICFAILVPFFAYDALRLSHRVAGPLYRIRQTLHAINVGDVIRPIKLRNDDDLKDVADELNELIELLAEKGTVLLGPPSKDSVCAVPGVRPSQSTSDSVENCVEQPLASQNA